MKSVLTIIGTRPEALKLIPVVAALKKSKSLMSKVCLTRQHTDLLDPFVASLQADYQLDHAVEGNSLQENTAYFLQMISLVLAKDKPDLVIVQGDTTTAFAGALSAFYARIAVAHVEAGLRTHRLDSPWPEEGHRCLIDRLATYFFAPTTKAKETLLAERVPSEKIWVVGNTSIDAVRLVRKLARRSTIASLRNIVVTVHRRENHGEPLKEICLALRAISSQFSDIRIQFLLHPNPAIRTPAIEELSGAPNIDLLEPVSHAAFIELLDESIFVITDSGGIQEEAPYLGKPIVIVRDTTERQEGLDAKTACLAGTRSAGIIACCKRLLENKEILNEMSKVHFPYGDGYAAERIVQILEKEL